MDMKEEIQRLAEAEIRTAQSIETLSKRMENLIDVNEKVVNAFPAGDMDGHRRYHEMMIEELEEKRRLRRAIKEKTVAGLIWAAIVWLGVAAFEHFQGLLYGVRR